MKKRSVIYSLLIIASIILLTMGCGGGQKTETEASKGTDQTEQTNDSEETNKKAIIDEIRRKQAAGQQITLNEAITISQENQKEQRSGRTIPTNNNSIDDPAPAMTYEHLMERFKEDRCAKCAQYKCISKSNSFRKGDVLDLGHPCTDEMWKGGCPLYVKTADGAVWEFSDNCRKC